MITEEDIRREYVSAFEATQLLNVNDSRVRQILRDNKLPGAFKFADTWLIPIEAIKHYSRQTTGKKPGRTKNTSKIEELKKENEWLRELLKEAKNNSAPEKVKSKVEETEEEKRAKLASLIQDLDYSKVEANNDD